MLTRRFTLPAIMLLAAGIAHAQVPPAIEAELHKIGQVVDPGCTAKLYRPLMPANDVNTNAPPLYPGFKIARDVSFGSNPKDVLDIFSPEKGGGTRPVLLYVPGGQGNKIEQQIREANAFYDNIGRWAVKNGMIFVSMQRHPGTNWDDGGRDVSNMIQWVQANIGKYQGNPDRMIIWTQSAGNGPVGIYIGHPELYGPKGVGVKGAIFMSGQFNILPLQVPAAGGAPGGPTPGTTCGIPAPNQTNGAIAGPSGVPPGPAVAAQGGGARGAAPAPPPVDPATQLARSSLPGFKKINIALLFASAELDPGINGQIAPFYQVLHDELCKDGNAAHCPTLLFEKGESHMSQVFSIDTDDKTVSGPILAWIKKVK